MRGRAAKKARIDAFFKPKAPAATRGPVTWDAPKRTNPVSTNLEVKPTVDDAGLVTIQLPKNRVGLWFLELEEKGGGLRCVALERFDLYNKVEAQAEAFHAHVARMPAGRVALVSITDTAMAKTRPLPKLVYDTLRLLGGEDHIEPIGYRTVRKSTSVLGAPDNSSLHFSAMTRPTWLSRAARNRHRHAIEQASRRWRGGRRDDSARTRRKIRFPHRPSLALWGLGALAGASGDPLRVELLACTAAGGLWVVGFPAFLRRLEAAPRERWRPGARKAS